MASNEGASGDRRKAAGGRREPEGGRQAEDGRREAERRTPHTASNVYSL
jgi:hypothetical protein